MKKSDKERLKKIVTTWDELQKQMTLRQITADKLLEDEFSQWAVTTPRFSSTGCHQVITPSVDF